MTAVVIGIGNEYRHDDAVALEIIRRLRRRHLPGVNLEIADGEPSRMLDLWDAAEIAIVVDAVQNDPSNPGRTHEFIVDRPVVNGGHSASTHGLGLGEAFDLALTLGRVPRRLVLLAVEGADFSVGVGLTPAVAARVDDLVEHIATTLLN